MSVEQTFYTPSFGDDEFDIPPLTYAPTAAATRCSGQGVYGNQVQVEYLKRKLSYDQIYVYLPRQEENFNDCGIYNQHPISHLRPPESFPHPHHHHHQQQQQSYHPLHSESPPQDQIMNNNQFHNAPPQQHQQQQQYQNDMMNAHGMSMGMQYENQSYSDSMQQGSMQHPQMTLMQQAPQQNHVMGPPQQVYPTINQNQISSQLGLQIGMGPPHQAQGSMGGSPPGSNHNSPGLETSEDSDDSTPLAQLMGTMKQRPTPEPVDTTVPKAAKKPKAQKKKKKRDPNEPQKPVSAYALFFRDTQAAIKGQNPNASFGEVSKIVASMWDSLDVESKNNYKKKTENAKKEYLKKLAAYRATLVSKAAVDQSDTMYGNNAPNTSPPVTNSPNSSPLSCQVQPGQQQKSPVYQSVVDTMKPINNTMNVHPQNQQVWPMQSPQHMTNNNSPPHVMQGGNGMVNMHQQQIQQPQMSPQQQMGVMNTRQQVNQMPVNSPQLCNSASNSPSYNQTMSTVSGGDNQMGGSEMMSTLPTCLRNGCSNPAVDSPDWDREYCSSECVVSHCKDVFANWVAQRQAAANPYSTVK